MADMGLGEIGNSELVFKRKFRWTFEVNDFCEGQQVPKHFVKLAARPNITIEEQEINFLNAKTWIPGKGTWETITVTYYDVAKQGEGANIGLWSWLASVYDFTDPVELKQSSTKAGYSGTGVLILYDGCGTELEEWTLGTLWPQAINFGELDYSSSEEVTIEVTLRYSEVEYFNFCGGQPNPCCTGCNQ